MPRASGLGEEIKRNLDAEIELVKGSGGVFEVSRDGAEIFSKKKADRFPSPEEILALLK